MSQPLTNQQVESLEATLLQSPMDLQARNELIVHYFCQHPTPFDYLFAFLRQSEYVSSDIRKLYDHVEWVIKAAPKSELAERISFFAVPEQDRQRYVDCTNLWLDQLSKSQPDVLLLRNAARFIMAVDTQRAAELLIQALAIEPDNTLCTDELDYVNALQSKDATPILQNRIKWAERRAGEARKQGKERLFGIVMQHKSDMERRLADLAKSKLE